jgi:His-Xaa-Ser system radical SAM maturase HxsC
MLKLSSNSLVPIGAITVRQSEVRRITENALQSAKPHEHEVLLLRGKEKGIPAGFAGYCFLERPPGDCPPNSFLLEPALSYLSEGDIVRIDPSRNRLRTLYRKSSLHNFLLVTERCNNFCLMCSQPPKEIDDSYLVDEILRMIPLMYSGTKEIGITGGEPSLLGEKLVQIIGSLKMHLPATAVHILSNGRRFKHFEYCKSIADIAHPDLMIGIPLYSDISSIHDYVVQADGAFDDTIRGIINLKASGVRVEIRIVVHKQTYERLPHLARFIRRNLTFCDHVTFMGLEITGFTRPNLGELWIDPKDYQVQLRDAVETLAIAKVPVSIYNHQLCLLDPALHKFNRKSISDWKNEYLPECHGCTRQSECGGFFSSSRIRHSAHISPFLRQDV